MAADRRRVRGLALAAIAGAVALPLAGCGSEGFDQCQVAVAVTPLDPVAPATLTIRATVETTGFLTYRWTVTRAGQPVSVTPRTPDARDVDVVADLPGVYQVRLDIDGGAPGCDPWLGDVNVRDPGGASRAMRLRFTPPSASAVPTQERLLVVPGGADYAVGVLPIDPGTPTPVQVRAADGTPVAAAVQLTSRSTPDATIELTTSATGQATPRLTPGRYDALVVPLDPLVPPTAIAGWDPGTGVLTLVAGQPVTGEVLDGVGQPVAGARVTITGGAPSTVGLTSSAGAFALTRQRSTDAVLTVVPPPASGLPRLTAPLGDLAGAGALTIRYAAGRPVRDLGGLAVAQAGVPAAGGHVLFALEQPGAATISDGTTTVDATGSHRDRVEIDDAGRLAPYRLTVGSGRAFVVPTTGPGGVALLTVTPTAPVAIDAPAAVHATAAITAAAAVVAGAQATAVIDGDLAHLGAPVVRATADGDGRLDLALAAGATYQVTLVDPRGGAATRRLALAGVATDLGAVELPAAIRVFGELRVVGQSVGLAAAAVTALCDDCAGLDRSDPLGAAVTDATGAFAVAVPDPSMPP
ncbi:MAG: hypothetical protein R3B06_09475 [Kofleriaceae bacterium]